LDYYDCQFVDRSHVKIKKEELYYVLNRLSFVLQIWTINQKYLLFMKLKNPARQLFYRSFKKSNMYDYSKR